MYAQSHNWQPTINEEARKFWAALDQERIKKLDLGGQIQYVYDVCLKTQFDLSVPLPRESAAETGIHAIDACRALKSGAVAVDYIQKKHLLSDAIPPERFPEAWGEVKYAW